MSRSWSRILIRVGVWGVLAAGGLAVIGRPEQAPGWVFFGLATTAWPLSRAWRGLRGTALGSAWGWGIAAVVLGGVGQIVGSGEALGSGRPWAAQCAYLSALATLAALISVFNARRPGQGAWTFLMGVMVLLFLLPWWERPGLGHLRLDPPWSVFFGLLALAGVLNYVPTRYGPASAVLAVGLGLELAGLTGLTWSAEVRARLGSAGPWTLALAVWLAEARSARSNVGKNGLERLWFWFRDHWGLVWGVRVLERFNRAAESSGWPIRLAWSGIVAVADPIADVPESAKATLKGLLRRFADNDRIDAESARTLDHPRPIE